MALKLMVVTVGGRVGNNRTQTILSKLTNTLVTELGLSAPL